MRSWTRTATVCALGALSLLPAHMARAQSVSELMEEYFEVYQERLEGIDDLLMVQTVMGFSTETYYEKTMVGGTAVLEPRATVSGGAAMPIPGGASEGMLGDPTGYLVEFAEQAEIEGTETVDGASTTVILIDDLSSLEIMAPGGQGGQSLQGRTMRIFLDTDDWVIRRMEMVAEATTPDGPAEVTADIDFSDFRDVAGMPQAHRTIVSVEGLEDAVPPEQLAQARLMLEQLQAQLENMTEEQRQAVEGMMSGQMDQLVEMLESGSMTLEVVTQEIRVNEGPPQA